MLALKRENFSNYISLFGALVASFIVCSILWLMWIHYIPACYTDEWPMVAFMQKVYEGRSSVGDWFGAYGFHRILVSRAIYWIDYALFNHQKIFIFYLIPAIQVSIFLALKRLMSGGVTNSATLSSVLSLLFLSSHAEAFYFCFNFKYFFINLIFIIVSIQTFYIYQNLEKRNIAYALCLIGSLVATLTLGSGIFIPLSLSLTCLIYQPSRIKNWLFLGGSCFLIAIYVSTLPAHRISFAGDTNLYDALKHISQVLLFFISFFGNVFGSLGSLFMIFFGVIAVVLMYAAIRQTSRNPIQQHEFVALSVMFFVAINALLVSIHRFSWSPDMGRYVVSGALFWIAQIIFWFPALSRKNRNIFSISGLCLFLFMQIQHIVRLPNHPEINGIPIRMIKMYHAMFASNVYDTHIMHPSFYYISPISPLVQFLKKHKLSFFHDPITQGLGCSIFDLSLLQMSKNSAQGEIIDIKLDTNSSTHDPEANYTILQGTAFVDKKPAQELIITDQNGIVIGFGVGGDYADLKSYTEFTKNYAPDAVRDAGIRDLPNMTQSPNGYIAFAHMKKGQHVRVYARTTKDEVVLING